MTTLATGFAAAVQPVAAQTQITTDAAGPRRRRGEDPGEATARCRPTRAMPAGGKNLPDRPGRAGDLRRARAHQGRRRRLAKAGYLAIAPELYARQGDVSKARRHRRHPPDRGQGARRAGDGRPRRHGRVGGEERRRREQARDHRLLLGRAHRVALRRAQPEAEGGRRVVRPRRRRRHASCSRRHPLDLAASMKAPVLGLYGGADAGIPNDTRRAHARRAQGRGQAVRDPSLYPDTPHGFHADYRPSYRKEAAEGRLEAAARRGSSSTAWPVEGTGHRDRSEDVSRSCARCWRSAALSAVFQPIFGFREGRIARLRGAGARPRGLAACRRPQELFARGAARGRSRSS